MTVAWVFAECNRGLAKSAQMAAKQLQGVLEAHSLNGVYDLAVKVQMEDERQFRQVITTLKRIAGIAAVATCIVYSSA